MSSIFSFSPAIIDLFPSGVFSGVCTGDEWDIVTCNAFLADFLKGTPDELAGESFFTALYRIEHSLAVDAIKNCKPNETVMFQVRRHSYAFIWTPVVLEEGRDTPARDGGIPGTTPASNAGPGNSGASLRYFMFHEVSQAPAQEDCDLLWRELKVILDSVHDGIWVIDAGGMTVHVNKALNRIAGIKAEDVLGKHVSAPMQEGKFTSCVTLRALEEQKAVTMFDDYATGKRCLNTSTPIFDDDGNIWRVVASIRDMSELESLQLKLAEAEREARIYKEKLERIGHSHTGFVGTSSSMRKCLRDLEKAAKAPSGMLILGETGTGKTLAASLIHQKSPRAEAPFITVNCAAIPPTLLEAELFGYEKGAFTGASQEGKKGFFEMADKGTLFLDEIGELPLNMQSKLLHVLDSYSFHRVGGVKSIKVDVRILAATNQPLEQLVKSGEFRADLYYRLRVLSVMIPPLREHPEDIGTLAGHFLEEACKRHGNNKFFDPKVLHCFTTHNWPGNVRELRATVEFLAAMTEGKIIKLRDLPPHLKASEPEAEEHEAQPQSLKTATNNLEAKMIKEALARTGSTYKAADLLGVSQSTVVRKAHKLRTAVPDV